MAKYLRICITCGKQSHEGRDFFEMAAGIGPRFICRECAAELGIKNFLSAGLHSNTQILKKYVKIHPEKQHPDNTLVGGVSAKEVKDIEDDTI